MDKNCSVCKADMKCIITGFTVSYIDHHAQGDLFICPNCNHLMIFGINSNLLPNEDLIIDDNSCAVVVDWAHVTRDGNWLVMFNFEGEFSHAVKSFLKKWEPSISLANWKWLS